MRKMQMPWRVHAVLKWMVTNGHIDLFREIYYGLMVNCEKHF